MDFQALKIGASKKFEKVVEHLKAKNQKTCKKSFEELLYVNAELENSLVDPASYHKKDTYHRVPKQIMFFLIPQYMLEILSKREITKHLVREKLPSTPGCVANLFTLMFNNSFVFSAFKSFQ